MVFDYVECFVGVVVGCLELCVNCVVVCWEVEVVDDDFFVVGGVVECFDECVDVDCCGVGDDDFFGFCVDEWGELVV